MKRSVSPSEPGRFTRIARVVREKLTLTYWSTKPKAKQSPAARPSLVDFAERRGRFRGRFGG